MVWEFTTSQNTLSLASIIHVEQNNKRYKGTHFALQCNRPWKRKIYYVVRRSVLYWSNIYARVVSIYNTLLHTCILLTGKRIKDTTINSREIPICDCGASKHKEVKFQWRETTSPIVFFTQLLKDVLFGSNWVSFFKFHPTFQRKDKLSDEKSKYQGS